jgi:hypothetical protein
MLEISKFKLIDGGRGGVSITAREDVQLSGNYKIVDEITRTRKLVLPEALQTKSQKLKYFLLNCTGHWMSPFNNYYDIVNHELKPLEYDDKGKVKGAQEILRNLFNKTEITGITYSHGGFVISGTIESIPGKKIALNTPFISEEDDLGFFSSAVEMISDCVHEIVSYFATHSLPAYKPENILSEEEMKGLDMSELTNKVVEKLVDRNMIMLIKDEGPESIPETTSRQDRLHTNTGSIDGANLPHSESQGSDDDEEQESAADKAVRENLNANAKPVFGRPASDSEMPEEFKSKDKVPAKDLELLEHSANMGIDTEPEENSKGESWEE